VVLSKAEVGHAQGAKLLKHKYRFTLWLRTSLYGSRSVRLQDLDFDENNSKLYKVKERPLRTTFDSFDTRIKKYIAAEKQ
jgi:hypothetical protein